MPRHTYECRKKDTEKETELGLICLLKDGQPAGSGVTFVVSHDGAEAKRLNGSVVADARARAGKAATVKYVPPLVPDDKTHYVITYKAIADGKEYPTDDAIHVWPRAAKLTCRNEDDTKPLRKFKVKVMQNGAQVGANLVTSGDDPSVLEFSLDKGAPFTLEGIDPYAFVEAPAALGGKLRDLKAKCRVNFVPEFISPKRPDDGELKQWVNLDADPAKNGTDQLGNVVELTVGVTGDRDDAGVTKPDQIGAAGIFVYVSVTFSGPGNKKSKRSRPASDLVAGLNLVTRTAVKNAATDPQWEFTGKVDLAAAEGVGKLKLNLGRAGADTCVIKLGSTVACAGPQLKFTNWRRRWYELMAPDFMDLDTRVQDGANVKDFVADGRDVLKGSGDATAIEYALFKSHTFTNVQAKASCKGSVLPREFFGLGAGPAERFLLTRFTMASPPKTFDGGKGARCIQLLACDQIFVNDGPAKHPDRDFTYSVTTAQADCVFSDPNWNWSPVSANRGRAGADSIKELRWTADIDPASVHGPANHAFEPDVADATLDGTGKDRLLRIEELNQNPAACTVTFKNPLIGHTSTSLDDAAKATLRGWLATLWTDAAVRPHGFALKFRIRGQTGDARRMARFLALHQFIDTTMATVAPALYKHPGVAADGTPVGAALAWADVVDMPRSRTNKIAINLPTANPTDPGNLVGPVSDTKCPIEMYVKWEDQGEINGNANNAWVVVKWGVDGAAAPKCVADTFLHEQAHRLGMAKADHGIVGMDDAKETTEADPDYATNGTLGHYYQGHGHSGGHCLYGASDRQKGRPSYQSLGLTTCFLYGEGGRDDGARQRVHFCPRCADIIRGLELK